MADSSAFPLWGPDGMISPGELPLSATLEARLARWAEQHDTVLGSEFEWPSEGARLGFVAEGRQLWALLRRELGDSYEIAYLDDY